MPGNIVYFDEDFETVDAGLTPDPYSSVTTAGGNTCTQAAVGKAGTNGQKNDFNGTSAICYGVLGGDLNPKFGTSYFIFNCRVVRDGFGVVNNTLDLFVVRTAAGDRFRVRWKCNTLNTNGKIQLSVNYGTTSNVDGSTVINRNVYFKIEVRLYRTGKLELYLDDALEITYDPGSLFTGNLNQVRVGTPAASATPGAVAEVDYDLINISQDFLAGGENIIFLGSPYVYIDWAKYIAKSRMCED